MSVNTFVVIEGQISRCPQPERNSGALAREARLRSTMGKKMW